MTVSWNVIIIKGPSIALGRNLMIKYSKTLFYALFVFLKILDVTKKGVNKK